MSSPFPVARPANPTANIFQRAPRRARKEFFIFNPRQPRKLYQT